MITDVSAMLVMAILFLVTFAWISLFAKVLRGHEILAFEPRRETPWGVLAVLLSFFLLIGCQLTIGLAFGATPGAEPTVAQTHSLLAWNAVAILAATLASIGLIHRVTRAGQEDFGISLEHVPRDIFVGLYAFLVLAPITFAIQYVFVYGFEFESHHPLIELLKEDTTGRLFGIVTVLAVVVAPISEEYFFRVLLQGWLEQIFLFRFQRHNEDNRFPHVDIGRSDERRVQASIGSMSEPDSNPYSPLVFIHSVDRDFVAPVVPKASSIPIVISAAIFAVMHWSHGPDPVALFVLAIGLGFLYQRTHRWLPCVVTHACLNGTTMLLLWFGLDELPS